MTPGSLSIDFITMEQVYQFQTFARTEIQPCLKHLHKDKKNRQIKLEELIQKSIAFVQDHRNIRTPTAAGSGYHAFLQSYFFYLHHHKKVFHTENLKLLLFQCFQNVDQALHRLRKHHKETIENQLPRTYVKEINQLFTTLCQILLSKSDDSGKAINLFEKTILHINYQFALTPKKYHSNIRQYFMLQYLQYQSKLPQLGKNKLFPTIYDKLSDVMKRSPTLWNILSDIFSFKKPDLHVLLVKEYENESTKKSYQSKIRKQHDEKNILKTLLRQGCYICISTIECYIPHLMLVILLIFSGVFLIHIRGCQD